MLLLLGHSILISITVLHVRKRAFQHKFKGISNALARRPAQEALAPSLQSDVPLEERTDTKGYLTANTIPLESSSRSRIGIEVQLADTNHHGISHDRSASTSPKNVVETPLNLNYQNYGARDSCNSLNKAQFMPSIGLWRGTQKYFESKGLISRNSQFHGLTPEERERLQGVEYKAVSFLSVIVPLYWLLFLCCGIMGMGIWLEVNKPQIPRENGLSPFWTGAFFAVSAFVNSGMGILDANMTALQTEYALATVCWIVGRTNCLYSAYPVITMGLLILAGNTLYPCFLRLIIWCMRRTMPDLPAWKSWRITLDFILDHPRRVCSAQL